MTDLNGFKKTSLAITRTALVASVTLAAVLSGCKNEDGNDDAQLAGTYVISKAVLADDTSQKVPVEDLTAIDESATEPAIIEGGTNVAQIFLKSLAEAGPCSSDPSKTAIRLKDNKKIAFVCTDSQLVGDETGEWYVSDGSLVILINTEFLGQNFTLDLQLKDYLLSGNKLTGTLEDFDFFPSSESITGFQTVTMGIEFTKTE